MIHTIDVYADQPAMEVEHGGKHYSDKVVLNDVNLKVEKGIIYGLLGPSGCGKTTLLSCLVGVQRLNAGRITIFGKNVTKYKNGTPGRMLGYMPQEISLYGNFTIFETFAYYGVLNGMTEERIKYKLTKLSSILNLPHVAKLVDKLSGGEQRRVSLGVALLHNPQLLVLDEPTVGIDPLLRETIWDYLKLLVKSQGTTVLMTTHYVEETANCEKIGYIRDGSLIVEDTPSSLLQKYDTNRLDDVVHKLCNNVEIKATWQDSPQIYDAPSVKPTQLKSLNVNNVVKVWNETKSNEGLTGCFDSDILKVLVKRNLTIYVRNPLIILLEFIVLVFNVYLFVYLAGNHPLGLKIGFVNNEGTCPENFQLNELKNPGNYSCAFISELVKEGLDMIPISSEMRALNDVKQGKLSGYISIPANFSEHSKARFLFGLHSDNETLDGSTVTVRLDHSEYLYAFFIRQTLYSSLQTYIQSIGLQYDIDSRVTTLPISFSSIFGPGDESWNPFLMPAGLLIVWCFYGTTLPLFYIQDKAQHTLARTLATGVDYYKVVLSYYIADMPCVIWQSGIMLSVMAWVKWDEVKGSWGLIFLIFYLVRLISTSISIFVGTFSKKELNCIFLAVAVLFFCIYGSDTFWPVQSIVWWYRPFCYCLPITYPLGVLRSVIAKGWGLFHPVVAVYGVCIPSVMILVLFGGGILIEKRNRKN
ncbi:ABC transporter G family member 23-like isoform X1 [Folsomia candida]|uniref:ABC transporter G family member 23-like isoform X1 n=1 Tax=Folsomia candida TaxID=158441 RepID=UPI00160529F0|nr:ABC transporter G family member 23-like isoform X1 [Folsomia candida]